MKTFNIGIQKDEGSENQKSIQEDLEILKDMWAGVKL